MHDFFLFSALFHIMTKTLPESNYVSQNVAQSGGLATVSGAGNFIIRTDNTTFLSPSGPGRNSIRIMSNKQYDTHVAM
jgi:hypothetical protein